MTDPEMETTVSEGVTRDVEDHLREPAPTNHPRVDVRAGLAAHDERAHQRPEDREAVFQLADVRVTYGG